jgi:DNA-binding phage protein
MSKLRPSAQRSMLANFQNRIRGVVGSVRSKKFEKEHKDKALRDRVRLNRIISNSRLSLSSADYDVFLNWSLSYTKTFAPSIDQARYQLDELGAYPSKPPLRLEAEISAACSRLTLCQETIAEFRSIADAIEDAFWQTDSDLIMRLLQDLEDTFGHSIWAIEANIAFRQLYEGLESQKKSACAFQNPTRYRCPYCILFEYQE